jgi:FG-GAP-like repeat
MTVFDMTSQSGRRRILLSLVLAVLATMLALQTLGTSRGPSFLPPAPSRQPIAPEATRTEVERACATCHAFPSPELFPKDLWSHEVDRGFVFLERAGLPKDTPPFRPVVEYYRKRAPDALPVLERMSASTECPVKFERKGYRFASGSLAPTVSNVRFVALSDERKLDLLVCDMVNGKVLLLKPYEPNPALRLVSDAIPNPAHAEVVDLDRDGIKDLIVANLGKEVPTDNLVGSVVWLRGRRDGSFSPMTLASGLGRVADVQAADFDGDGDLDLVVAEFGWLKVGKILLLENRTTDSNRPSFIPSAVDPRHGTIHVPTTDLNGDGRPDFVALISQEHETVVAFLNAGNYVFEPKVIFEAPHPAFGSSGIQLVDLDGDGDQDVVLTNGDSMDSQLLRPYHGVQWLENRGSYPFTYHHLTSLYGAQRAVAADIDGDGDLDVTAVCFLPGYYYQGLRRDMNLDAVVVLEQDAPGHFVRYSLETVTCDHATCDLGDFDADGKIDLVTGNAFIAFGGASIGDRSQADWFTLWKNRGSPATERPRSLRIPPLK